MIKTARKRAVSFELTCPTCGATIPSSKGAGSYFWTLEEMDLPDWRIVDCADCGARVRIPKGEPK